MSWYAPYKAYGDLIITGFVYVFFIWRIFIKLPGIISGTSGVAENLYNIDNFEKKGGGSK